MIDGLSIDVIKERYGSVARYGKSLCKPRLEALIKSKIEEAKASKGAKGALHWLWIKPDRMGIRSLVFCCLFF